MSGHSHYATVHRQKELKDAAKGQIFSKFARKSSTFDIKLEVEGIQIRILN